MQVVLDGVQVGVDIGVALLEEGEQEVDTDGAAIGGKPRAMGQQLAQQGVDVRVGQRVEIQRGWLGGRRGVDVPTTTAR